MKRWDVLSLKCVRWTGWPLLIIVLGFLLTGYSMSGRFGFSALMTEKQALLVHKLLHLPLGLSLGLHTLPAVYLALQRWRWIKK